MRTGPKAIVGLGEPVFRRGPLAPNKGGGAPVAPAGFQILLGRDGRYLTGVDGAPLYGKAA